MKKITLNANYFITCDSNQWVLNYEKTGEVNPKTNKPTISTNTWYCSSLESCLRRYVNEVPKVSETIHDIFEMLSVIEDTIKGITLESNP